MPLQRRTAGVSLLLLLSIHLVSRRFRRATGDQLASGAGCHHRRAVSVEGRLERRRQAPSRTSPWPWILGKLASTWNLHDSLIRISGSAAARRMEKCLLVRSRDVCLFVRSGANCLHCLCCGGTERRGGDFIGWRHVRLRIEIGS